MDPATRPFRGVLSLCLIGALLALGLLAKAQDNQKPSSETQKSPSGPTSNASPEPSPPPNPKQSPTVRMGTELDSNSLITNTDLITLTVTVTDTYGRYVSGLNQKAFAIFDDKLQQEITNFRDDDSPVYTGGIFDVYE